MDAAVHRVAEAQGREPVNRRTAAEPKSNPAGGRTLPDAMVSAPVPVGEGYERWAPIYDSTPNPLLACEERYLLPFLADLSKKRILDLACGTGRWLERVIARGGPTGVGIDCSDAMLRVAGRKDAITGRLARAACENLPFRAAVFDLAICSFALGHIRDLEGMARELARVTKPGAEVFLSDLHPEAYVRGWRVGFRDGNSAVHVAMLPRVAEEIVETFQANGFECLARLSLCLGDPEEPIFARAGKANSFKEACQIPAVLLCRFRRLESPRTTREGNEYL
jgi:ubiquinone/menaquinone biosynthesis C-methylase UbiE